MVPMNANGTALVPDAADFVDGKKKLPTRVFDMGWRAVVSKIPSQVETQLASYISAWKKWHGVAAMLDRPPNERPHFAAMVD